ncbi:MAG: agmatine deiminase family protein [Halofilum sp. (in: g-proteobacteria)]|nr:agmatine deiminase family protein [Halofilum sp. (in: g-proteobacteria)]
MRQLPAEWAPQGAVMLAWPHADTGWGPRLDACEDAFAALCTAITRHEALVVACRDRRVREHALAKIAAAGSPRAAVTTVIVASDDTWIRDIAPLAVLDDGLPVLVDCAGEAAFGRALVDSAGFATLGYERAPLALAGGALDTDGAGTLLVNRAALAPAPGEPETDPADTEAALGRALGATRVLWLNVPPLGGDATHGHVDTLARFCDPGTIAHAAPHDPDDADAPALQALAEQLAALRSADGEPYRLVPLPAPAPVNDAEGTRCPASYASFLVINGAVLVPAFADPADGGAVEALQPLFPDRIVLPVPARTFAGRGRGLHDLAVALPEGVFEDLALS